MSQIKWTILSTTVLLPLLAVPNISGAGSSAIGGAPVIGTKAPDFTLNSQEGKPVSLHDFHGKWVVLYFYPKDFTSGCTLEAHNFQQDLKRYEQMNAVILGVSVQSADSHKEFCAKEGLNFRLLADTDRVVSTMYDAIINLGIMKISARHTFLINPEGVIAREFMDVKPSRHSQEVLAVLSELNPLKNTADLRKLDIQEVKIRKVADIPMEWKKCSVDSDCAVGVMGCWSWVAVNKEYIEASIGPFGGCIKGANRSCRRSLSPGPRPRTSCIKGRCTALHG